MVDRSATLIDLFAGCGGLSLGLHDSGFQTVLANELYGDPAKTYSHNLLRDRPEAMRVGPIDKQLSAARLERWIDENGSDVGCIAGGPPCQGFSMAGRGDRDDPRNFLFKEYLRVVRKVRPRSVIFENVPGFANRYGMGLRRTLNGELNKMGYTVADGILKAHDFGVPQLRKRYFAIGIRKEILGDEELGLPSPTYDLKMQDRELTSEKVIGDLDTYEERGGYGSGTIHGDWEYRTRAKGPFQRSMRSVSGIGTRGTTWNTRIPNHTPTVIRRMGAILEGRSRGDFVGTSLETAKNQQRAIMRGSVPNITVVSIPDDYVHYNHNMPRTLSVRECARLQTFPDHFHFLGKRTSGGIRRRVEVPQYTQVGNAVPPRLAESLGNLILGLI